jgi:ligand-binding sensor domain-containing protein
MKTKILFSRIESQIGFLIIILLLFISPNIFSQNREYLESKNEGSITAFADAGNILWIGTEGCLIKLNKITDSLTFYNNPQSGFYGRNILSLKLDLYNNLWIGSSQTGLTKYDGSKWENISKLCPRVIEVVDSSLYLGFFSDEIKRFDYKSSWITFKTQCEICSIIYTDAIKADKRGIVWLGGNWVLGKIESDSLKQGFALVSLINDFEVDKNNNLWISSYRNGLVKYDGEHLTFFDTTSPSNFNNYIRDLKFDMKGNLILGTDSGLIIFDEKYFVPIKNSPRNISKIEIDHDDIIWVGTKYDGLFKYDGLRWKKYDNLVGVEKLKKVSNRNFY